MAKQCTICQKKSAMGRQYKKLMSKYNPTPKKRKYPNLQSVKIPAGIKKPAYSDSRSIYRLRRYKEFAGKRIIACAKCIKAMGKTK